MVQTLVEIEMSFFTDYLRDQEPNSYFPAVWNNSPTACIEKLSLYLVKRSKYLVVSYVTSPPLNRKVGCSDVRKIAKKIACSF